MCPQNCGGERFRQVFSSSKCVADIVGQFFDVIPVSIRRDARPVKCSKRQRALSQVDGGVIALAEGGGSRPSEQHGAAPGLDKGLLGCARRLAVRGGRRAARVAGAAHRSCRRDGASGGAGGS